MNTWLIGFVVLVACKQGAPEKNASEPGSASGTATPSSAKPPLDATTPPATLPLDATASGSRSAGPASGASDGGSAAPVDFTETDLCLALVKKVQECLATPEFVAALDEGATPAQKKLNAKLRKQTKKEWPYDPRDVCHTFFQEFAFSHPGFLDHPATLTDASLASCSALGTAIENAGGLVGGEIAN